MGTGGPRPTPAPSLVPSAGPERQPFLQDELTEDRDVASVGNGDSAPEDASPERRGKAPQFVQMFSWMGRRLAIAITMLWLVAALPGLAVLTHGHVSMGPLGEALSYLALAMALASITKLRAVFAQTPRPLGALLAASAVLVVFGQLGGGGRYVYPLVRFNVYTDPILTTCPSSTCRASPPMVIGCSCPGRSCSRL